MNKKFLTSLLFVGLLAGLVGCNKGPEFSDKVLKDEESAGWVLHGQIKLADGTDNGWNGKDKELYDKSMMKAVSIKEVSEIDIELARTLNGKNVKFLYMYEGAQLGVSDAGWTAKFHDATDFYQANGSYVFKAAKVSYDSEDEVYAEELWMPDPKKSHAEALTNNVFIPTWQEKADEWGFSWANDLCVTGGAGKYTIIYAQYDVVQSATVPGFGLAAIKTEAATGGQEYVKLDKFNPAEHTLGLVGSFNGWGAEADVALTLSEGKYVADLTIAGEEQVKVRADSDWANNWGFSAVDTDASCAEAVDADGNIKLTAAGTYHFAVSFSVAGIPSIVITK